MQKNAFVASGRIIIDDFHERFFLFVSDSTHITLDGKTVVAAFLPETDRPFAEGLLQGLDLVHLKVTEFP